MRLFSNEMNRLHSGFRDFFRRREYLESLASEYTSGPLTAPALLQRVVDYYITDILPNHQDMGPAEATAEIEDFLGVYSVPIPPLIKSDAFKTLLAYKVASPRR
jgi:hypothetical protein